MTYPPSLSHHISRNNSLFYPLCFFFFFNDTATTEIYTLSLHDALPIWNRPALPVPPAPDGGGAGATWGEVVPSPDGDRKSTRLNSSHGYISYAVFCLKKKKNKSKTKTSMNA